MPSSGIILIRHAATAANDVRPYILQGREMDLPLNEQGCAQARGLAAALTKRPLAAIYTSPLTRARETAEVLAEPRGLVPEVMAPLIEARIGQWEGLSWPAIADRWPVEYQQFQEDPASHPYLDGENFVEVRDRAAPVLLALAQRHPGDWIAVVSHNVVNRVLLAHWLGIPLRHARRIPQDNAGYSIIERTGETLTARSINLIPIV